MRFQLDKQSNTPIYHQVREQLISALHVGRVNEGSKLPSVRHFARVHGINPKTIHRIYRRLHDEGYLHLRPGSGAYIAPVQRGSLDGDRLLSLHRFFRAALAECQRIGLEPARACGLFERFVNRASLPNTRIGVVECSAEQANVLSREIRAALKAQVVPISLDDLQRSGGPNLAAVDVFVTTATHVREVEEAAARLERPTLLVRHHDRFLASLREAARRGRLLVVVDRAAAHEACIRETLRGELGEEESAGAEFISVAEPERLRSAASRAGMIYVTPAARDRAERYLPAAIPRLSVEPQLAPESIDLIEAAILFEGDGRAES
jgi:DNA-binding transcriptional regulator YhcF (GntR family)